MGSLVQDLLALARLDDGKTMEQRPVELVSIVAESVNAANLIDPAWPVKLIAPQPIDCAGDATRIRQLIDNLLTNVRAHTPTGTNTEVKLNRIADTATIIVADNGPGMTEDQAKRIDPSRSRRSGGAGLGWG